MRKRDHSILCSSQVNASVGPFTKLVRGWTAFAPFEWTNLVTGCQKLEKMYATHLSSSVSVHNSPATKSVKAMLHQQHKSDPI